jgi:hypothetical protein
MSIFSDEFRKKLGEISDNTKDIYVDDSRNENFMKLVGLAVIISMVSFLFVAGHIIGFIWIIGIWIWIYLLPAYVAWSRYHNNTLAVFMVTLLFGWSVIGWCIGLVWACTKDTARPEHIK